MKHILAFLSLVLISTVCQAQLGIELNGTFYANGSTAVLPCGVQNVYARVRDGSVYRFCLNQNAIKIQPAGWTHGSDGSDNCPSFQTTATTGGTLKLEYATGFTGQTFTVQINIERPVPANLSITGPGAVCSGSTQTFSINNPPPGTIDWTTGPNLARTGANGGTSTQISNTGNGSSSVSVSINTSNGCGVVNATTYLNAGTPVVEYPNLWLFDAGSNMWQFSHAVSPGATSWTYYVASGSATLQQNGGDCYITTTNGASVCVYATNSCGTGTSYCFNVPAGGGGYMRAVSPNPAKDRLSLQFNDAKSAATLPSDVYLYSEKSTKPVISITVQEVYKQKAFEDGDKINVSVSDLPRGTYYLHVVPGQDSKQPAQRIRVVLD